MVAQSAGATPGVARPFGAAPQGVIFLQLADELARIVAFFAEPDWADRGYGSLQSSAERPAKA
jgi:hypothetical protein